MTNNHHRQQRQKARPLSPPRKVFRNILDDDSVDTATTVATSFDFDETEHQLHPSHVPTPKTLMHEFDLGEVLPMTTSVLEDALGGIQQSLQKLLDKNGGNDNSNQ